MLSASPTVYAVIDVHMDTGSLKIKIKIKESGTNTRVVVKVTHFKNKKFHGFVTFEDAKYLILQ
jgi:HSP20 family molecular chaperone IbpA